MRLAVTILVFCVTSLLALGMVMLYSASFADPLRVAAPPREAPVDPSSNAVSQPAAPRPAQVGARYLVKQLTACALGVCLCLAAACLDYRLLKKMAWPLFILSLVLLALVFVPHIGLRRNGALRWIGYGKTSLFQPSEFAKLGLIVLLAWWGDRHRRQMGTFVRGMVLPGMLICLVLGLVFPEPDVGNALLIATVSGIVLLAGGIRLAYFLPPVLAGALAVGAFIYHNPMRSERIYAWLHVEETRKEKGLQAYEAMVALGSGGWWGKGLGDGRQKLGFLPEHHTDFIFSIIGEELGLVATLLVVAAFVALVSAGAYISWHAAEPFGLLLGTGLTFLIGLQAFINIGVVTSALPNKGLPLPFISYGGSNLLAMLVCVGILLSISRRARARDEVGEALNSDKDAQAFSSDNPFRAPGPGTSTQEATAR